MRFSIEIGRLRAVLVALVAALSLVGSSASAQETCVSCHSTQQDLRLRDPVERLRGSVHDLAMGCSGCHGGRGNEPTVQAHDVSVGFVARPDPATVADRCGTCHADARFIRRHRDDLPTDQLALFHADSHGLALAQGNLAAPSCLGCHGSHDVRAPNDPASRVARRRQHETCGGCHSDPARMAGTRLPTNQAALWAESVHGRAVLAHGSSSAPTCAGCHGAHGEHANHRVRGEDGRKGEGPAVAHRAGELPHDGREGEGVELPRRHHHGRGGKDLPGERRDLVERGAPGAAVGSV